MASSTEIFGSLNADGPPLLISLYLIVSTVFSLNNTMEIESLTALTGLYSFNAPEGEGEKNITFTIVSTLGKSM